MMIRNTPTRRGAIYVLVLVVSIIVTLIGILAQRMVQSQARVARIHAQRDKAAALAESAVQWGIHLVSLNDAWRVSLTSGSQIRTMNLGEGQISVTITDKVDGDLADSETDEFTITGTGTIGDAVQTYSVSLEIPVGAAHPSLDKSLTAGGRLEVDPGTLTLESGGTARSQYNRLGLPYVIPTVTISNPVDLPNPALIDIWVQKGTVIPAALHKNKIESATFSSTAAPYGITPNPDGIYVIDGGAKHVEMRYCQIQGTLIVKNLGGKVLDLEACRFSFGANGGPTLIVDGDASFDTGFAAGVSQGLMYVNGFVEFVREYMMVGTMIATGNVTVKTTYVSINDHPSATAGPPEGFNVPESLRVKAGSWQRNVN